MPTDTTIDPNLIFSALSRAKDEATFIQELLAVTLNWPIPDEGIVEIDEITYDWPKDERKAPNVEKKLVGGRILEVNLTGPSQHWGIFVLEFNNPAVFDTDRGMTGVLREVLRWLVPRRRDKTGDKRSWNRDHLLFICTHDYSQFRFAYFKDPIKEAGQPRLAAFGWQAGSTEVRTVCEFNLSHLGWPDDPANKEEWADKWAEAFDVEKVTKKFYKDYAYEFERLRKAVKGITGEEQKMFTQNLLNRLMFLRFIERKKEWLFAPGQRSSTDYLRRLFKARRYRGKSFYSGRLKELFFIGLAVEGKQESEAIGKVQFLNGGLFEATELDSKVDDLPDDVFEPLLADDGLFYRYNFTVEESTPLNVEVAVDPEMLGKVFEELVTGRHESGAYYTPREVVTFMLREGMKGYLRASTQLRPDQINKLVDEHQTKSVGIGIKEAEEVVRSLDLLRAVDPACGSGAYLLGLLHEIVALYGCLYHKDLLDGSEQRHQLKLRVISNSIYGVDSDEFATNIAKLRLWLSLAVDSDRPKPLPNLDFKVECGDSLAGPDPSEYVKLQANDKARELGILKHRFFDVAPEKKESTRRLIGKLKGELRSEMQNIEGVGFDWRVEFAEVFYPPNGVGGFSLVFANPPYVRQELLGDVKPTLKLRFHKLYRATADLYIYFYFRGCQLLRDGGTLAFIAPNKFFRAGYGDSLRKFLAHQTELQTVIDFRDYPIFDATTYPSIIITRKSNEVRKIRDNEFVAYTWEPTDRLSDIRKTVKGVGFYFPQQELDLKGWRLETAIERDLFRKIEKAGRPLKSVEDHILRGLLTGFNEAFVIDGSQRKELIAEDARSNEIIRPFLRGKDVKRWRAEWSGKYLIWTYLGVDISRYPAIKKHLDQYEDRLRARTDQGDEWWELRACDYYDDFKKPKIIYPDIFQHQSFALDESDHLMVNTLYFIPSADIGLLGILNSRLMEVYYARISNQIRGGYMRAFTQYIKELPIANVTPELRKRVDELLSAAKQDGTSSPRVRSIEAKIDDVVYELYGLTKLEIEAIESRFDVRDTDVEESVQRVESFKERVFSKQTGED